MQLPVFLLIQASAAQQFSTAALATPTICQQLMAIAQSHGAVSVAKYDVEWMHEAGETPRYFKVLSFPDRQAIQALFDDPGYQALILSPANSGLLRHYVVSEQEWCGD